MSKLLDIKYEKFKLKNGLEIVLYENKSYPFVSINIWYKVGSANETTGKTGFAHLFEHMMFQGSQNVPKEMHFKYIQENGGSLNGSTSMDRTNYYQTVPPDSLELVLWLESDRMGYLIPSLDQKKLDNQKDVVMNERRQNYDNQPYGLVWEILFSNLFPSNHPYHWPTIGYMADIKNFELSDVKEFFKKYYAPSNASLVIGGNFDTYNAEKLVKKYFDPIPSKKSNIGLGINETKLVNKKEIVHEDNVKLKKLYFAWHSEKAYESDDATFDIIAEVLAGSKSSRLYKSLVYENQLAQDVSAFQYSANLCGVFFVIITLKINTSENEISKLIFEELTKLKNEIIDQSELEKSKNAYRSSFIYSLQNLENLVNQINNYNCSFNNPNGFAFDMERYNRITSEDILNTSKKYLNDKYVKLLVVPKK